MSVPKFKGLDENQELDPRTFLRDTRPFWRQLLDQLGTRAAGTGILVTLVATIFLFPESTLAALFVGLNMVCFRKVMIRVLKEDRLPMRLPKSADQVDLGDPIPGRRKFFKAAGIFLLGNEFRTMKELWLKAEDMLTHFLILGTTGSGKTETLISLCFNVLAMGSGFFYVDPKAAPKLAAQGYVMTRMLGRDDDYRVLNYGTSGKPMETRHPKRLTNTTNPWAKGSAENLAQGLGALLPVSDGDNAVFGQNAMTLLSSMMVALTELRDKGHIEMSIKEIRDHLTLNKVVELAEDPRLSSRAQSSVQSFLSSVGWQKGKPIDKQPRSLPEQFGYARSYFSNPLQMLTDSYAHVYLTTGGEVDMYDTIVNRRILFTLLPSLEKAPQELQSLGKITLSAVRNATSVGLGDSLEGTFEDVLESLPTASSTPFLSVTDEYAAIPTPGYAEVLTQGRGLGISALVGSQDFAGIKGADETSAKQIVSNTRIKVAMKMEDPLDTWELFKQIAAEATIVQTQGFKLDHEKRDMAMSYTDQLGASTSQMARINIQDLQQQIEGEFHAFMNGRIVRGSTFYANPPLESNYQLRINKMVEIHAPAKQTLEIRLGKIKALTERLIEMTKTEPPDPGLAPPNIALLKTPFDHPGPFKGSRIEQAVCALLHWAKGNEGDLERFQQKRMQALVQKGSPKCQEAAVEQSAAAGSNEEPAATPVEAEKRSDMAGFLPTLPAVDEPDEESPVEQSEVEENSSTVEVGPAEKAPVEEAWAQQLQEQTQWCQDAVLDPAFREDMVKAEVQLGATPEEAERMAETTQRDLAQGLSYPVPPSPSEEKSQEELSDAIQRLISRGKQKKQR